MPEGDTDTSDAPLLRVAFLEDRTALRVINLKDKSVRTVLDGKYNYSYSDGDQEYQWSPDSKWFLVRYIGVGGWNNTSQASPSKNMTYTSSSAPQLP